MKPIIIAILALSLTASADPINVVCGVPSIATVIKQLGGERVTLRTLMDGQQDPCVYSPSPKTVAAARDADLFITAGMPYESHVGTKLQSMNPSLKIIDLSSGIDTAGDPHIWMSLVLLEQMAGKIEQALSLADPDGAAFYRERLNTLRKDVSTRHEQLKQKLAPVQGITFYVYHPVLGHFANDYGLKQQTVELHGKSPTPKQLLGLILQAKEEKVQVVFVQPQFNDRPARIVAERIGGQVLPVNPIADDVISVIEQVAESIVQAYAPRSQP
ncbi:MAG: hypothetical protein FJ220_06105 [Kiritimatiellaceae bacterium]|nr:hypothetical protein [Kiritimatiellaceae bacterium]